MGNVFVLAWLWYIYYIYYTIGETMKELKSILSTTFTAYVFVVATIILVVFLIAPSKVEKPTVDLEVRGLENLEMHDLTFPITEYDVDKVT